MVISAAAALVAAFLASPGDAAAGEPYVPQVEPASGEAELAMQEIQVPGGLRVDLFAAEPMLANPVAFCIDERGRFFVAETFRVNAGVTDTRHHMVWMEDDLASRTVEDRVAMFRKHLGDISTSFTAEHERVRLIEDTDGDGKADRATVFADGFHEIADGIGAGVLARGGDVWFTCIPRLWLLRDEDGDGRADFQKALHNGYGVHVGYYGHDLHGLRFGPDGRLYFSIGDRGLNVQFEGKRFFYPDTGAVLRCEPDGSRLEVIATGLRNPQELAFNDVGDLFTGDNNSDGGDKARWVHVVEGGDCGWRIGYQFIEAPVSRGPWNAEKLWHPRWDGQAAYIIPPIANIGDGPSGLAYYPGTGLPPRYDGHFFLCDFRGVSGTSGIRTFALEKRGASYEMTDQHQFAWSVLATDCDFGPDGAMYISDWVTGWDKTGKGRIYRVSDPVLGSQPLTAQVRSLLAEGMTRRSTAETALLLGHADMRVRQEAQFALAGKGFPAIPALFGVAKESGSRLARLHATWALGQIARKDATVAAPIIALLDQEDSEVRAQAARVLGDAGAETARTKLVALLADPEPRVRFFAAMGLARVGQKEDVAPLLELLHSNADRDLYVRHAAVMALAAVRDADLLLAAAKDASAPVRLGLLLALRRLESPHVASFLEDGEERLVVEAAHAINDVPIESALPRLAALRLKAGMPDALLLRVLNASFRLGKAEHAGIVAAAAARDDLTEAVRVEALSELAAWAAPSGRDRVMGLWRPLGTRSAEGAATALRRVLPGILEASPDRIRVAAIEAAAHLGLKDAGRSLHHVIAARDGTSEARAAALKALETLDDPMLLDAVRAAVSDADPGVRQEGQRILARLRPGEAVPVLEAALEHGTTAERQGALASLAELKDSRAVGILSTWMDRLLAGAVPLEIELDLIEAAAQEGSPVLEAKLAKRDESRTAGDPAAPFRECLAGGDTRRGRIVFYEKKEVSCQRCHKAEGSGGDVGPNLAGIGSREKREHLLESLIAPNQKITKGYDTVALLTTDGKVYTGVLKDEDDRRVRITSPQGTLLAVPKDSIAERSGGVSAMPEDVSKFLTKREIRDLVEYLASLK